MAQRTEKEETEFKVPETLTLCVNNCGVTGNPATNNMCQKCFNATTSTSNSTAVTPTTTVTSMTNSPTISAADVSSVSGILTNSPRCSGILTISPRSSTSRLVVRDPSPETSDKVDALFDREKSEVSMARREVNRCSGCRRRVGLTGFRCRCGELFCWEHRYSDRHDCSYDYKSAGREAIARENPVVKAAKIVRV
ncbi:zinc finger A20 and AN1 domain-containing stress-associated protein 5 [Euphorbia lathyris]|uniref:zinc finger A20 and AN1 domain-containing stress-associated protein 5 n=1 Tax=Euphorbia lathyris TaxID=212925 RepID=UPI0033135AD9